VRTATQEGKPGIEEQRPDRGRGQLRYRSDPLF